MAEFLVTLTRHQYKDVKVEAETREEAIEIAWSGGGNVAGTFHGDSWEFDGCEELD